jgi:hypothetical protein
LGTNQADLVMLDDHRSTVGKILYYTTKMAPDIRNAARELTTQLSNPNEEQWKALERCVRVICYSEHEGLILRGPRELTSISDTELDYAKDENGRKRIFGKI